MARACAHAIALTLACAILCSAALAADEEAAQTGTIEIEVVYEDTGEPVVGVAVVVYTAEEVESVEEGDHPDPCAVALLPASGRIAFGRLAFDRYQVSVWPSGCVVFDGFGFGSDYTLQFCPSLSEGERQVTLLADSPVAGVRFAVERGWTIEGVVRRVDGSVMSHAYVQASWEAKEESYSSSCRIDSDGRYELPGLAPGSVVQLVVRGPYSVTGGHEGSHVFRAELWRNDVLVTEDLSRVDIDLDTASLEVTLDVVLPLWPFSRGGERSVEAVGFVVWDQGEPSAWGPHRIKLRTLPRASFRVLPKDRHVFTIADLPPGERIALAVGVAAPRETGFGQTSWGSYRWVRLRDRRQAVRLTVYEPGARASYCFWFAVAAIIVLAVCVPILARQARRRREGERSR